nr:MBL fold metallo-hydrolase [Acholeplasmatales bacterium]
MLNKDILYVGVDDHDIDLFEGQYVVENGMSYNSYVIMDEKICIMDSVDKNFGKKWIDNIKKALDGKKPTYLVVSHMEPDHSSNIMTLCDEYKDVTVVYTAKASQMAFQFFGKKPNKELIVKENDTLDLGSHKLKFITAPFVHWPEVMFTYDETAKTIFTADAFGKFGTLDFDDPEGWSCEARRYYFGIVGKYGAQVQSVLKKISSFEIKTICPLHGPVLDDDISYYLKTYDTWSKYEAEDKGVFIAYASIYGNTEKACFKLKELLEAKGVHVSIADMAREDFHESIEDAFRYDRLVLASPTYNGGLFPVMNSFVEALIERNY